MANHEEVALMSHLMRRAGFGERRGEIERLVDQGYEETVEQLLRPEDQPDIDFDALFRYLPQAVIADGPYGSEMLWLYRMVMNKRPLQEKMALFWHHVFATGNAKVEGAGEMRAQIGMFREQGMGNYRGLLLELGKNPAMIRWLDNHDNHKRAPNENWGRELMELFSMGVGGYTEHDVKEAARAYTGWSYIRRRYTPWKELRWRFDYRAYDHDPDEKTFLGHSGKFNGEDVVDMVVHQPVVSRFIARHLYNFFVADEAQVPAWPFEPAQDQQAIDEIASILVKSDFEMKPVLRLIFNSDFFKQAQFKRVRSPAEVMAGALRLSGDMNGPDPRWPELPLNAALMGQTLYNPPSVEGWHTGREWVNSGAFMNRVNFVSERVSNPDLPGVKEIVDRVAASNGTGMKPEQMVDACLDQMGPLPVSPKTREELVEQATGEGDLSWATDEERHGSSQRVAKMLALIVGTREYQFG